MLNNMNKKYIYNMIIIDCDNKSDLIFYNFLKKLIKNY